MCTCGKRWTQIHVYPIGKGLSDKKNHNFEQLQVAQGVLSIDYEMLDFLAQWVRRLQKKKFWIFDFTRFYCPSEFSGL